MDEFIRYLYWQNCGDKKKLGKLYEATKKAVMSWNGQFDDDYICIDDSNDQVWILEQLQLKQYCGISNGSACNSHSYSPSYVLTAMGLPEEQIESSIRVSWGALTDIQLVRIEFGRLLEYVKSMQ